ncbi:E3 binding domain-containing protein, partial [Candidatus Aerophobetes bacterium]|nr:E3 binding domain-containing protein [Candidatus Aerophobetes bacterium]
MATEVIMPKLGMMMEEGTVTLWLKKEGESVSKGEGILEIMTDKANYEIESPQDGVLLKVLAGENEVRPVGHILGVVGEEDEDISDLLSRAERQKKEERKTEAPKKEEVPLKEKEGPSEPGRIKISPVAKRLAKEHGVDLTRIKGSGPEGRVIRADILEAV